jgi:hypothetical protein
MARPRRRGVRRQLGVPAGAALLARHAGARLTRGDYQGLVTAGLTTPEAVEAAGEDALLASLGEDGQKARAVRDAAAAVRAELPPAPLPILPDYEG